MKIKNSVQSLALLACAFTFCMTSAQEGFKIGAQAGLPIGEINDQIGVVVGADVGYAWAPNKIFDLGIKAGFIHGFPEKFKSEIVTVELPSVQFAPVAATLRVWPGKVFSFGGEVGHALGLNEGNDGGFYYRPQFGIQTGPQSEINFSYTVIDGDGAQWSTLTLGYVYTFLSARHYK